MSSLSLGSSSKINLTPFVKIRQLFLGHPFLRKVMVLASGTGVAQFVGLAAAPILTRLYSPEDFGIFSVYVAMISLFVVISSFRYELSIPLPSNDRTAINLLVLSFIITLLVSLILLFGVNILFPEFLEYSNGKMPQEFKWIFPISVLLAGIYQASSYWAVRMKLFSGLAVSKISQSLTQTVTQLFFGHLSMGSIGLLFGDILGRGSGTLTLIKKWWNVTQPHLKSITYSNIKSSAYEYKRFPLLSTFSGFINQAGLQGPTLLLATFFSPEIAGLYALGQKTFAVPMDLIGQSISKVYLAEASPLAVGDPAALNKLFLKNFVTLFVLSLGPAIVLIAFGPYLFSLVFGSDWEMAGVFVQILAIPFILRLAISPISQTLNILQRQDIQLFWDSGRLALVGMAIIFPAVLGQSITNTIFFYALAVVITQVSYFFIAWNQIKRKKNCHRSK